MLDTGCSRTNQSAARFGLGGVTFGWYADCSAVDVSGTATQGGAPVTLARFLPMGHLAQDERLVAADLLASLQIGANTDAPTD